jgi:hypothetical protein
MKAGYVRNIERDPHVRLKLREGLRYQWHTGTAYLLSDDDPRERQRWLASQLPSRCREREGGAPVWDSTPQCSNCLGRLIDARLMRPIEGEAMTREARIMSGIILITVPTIQYGGYFLLTSLMNKGSGYMENPLRQNFFRAGHAHAGVIVILSLVCQIIADAAVLPAPLLWFVRIGVPLAAILISAGFFFSVLPPTATQASGAVTLICAGAVILAFSVVTLGIGLLRQPA